MLNQNTDYLSNVIFSGKYITNIVRIYSYEQDIFTFSSKQIFWGEKNLVERENHHCVWVCDGIFSHGFLCIIPGVIYLKATIIIKVFPGFFSFSVRYEHHKYCFWRHRKESSVWDWKRVIYVQMGYIRYQFYLPTGWIWK